ncbi:MAG: hypothetical protein ACJ8GJ_00940 [Vitreoscilla sp.]
MNRTALILAISLVALAGGARAADDAGKPQAKSTLATSANTQLRQADVPSVKTDPQGADSVKAKADADIAARNARDKAPRLQVRRENLKGNQAAQAIRQQTNPNTIDRDTAYGDKDHTQQVTDLRISVKK